MKEKCRSQKPNAPQTGLTDDRSEKAKECGVTKDEFAKRIAGMMQTLYRVSYAQLSQSCDREDAVQECLCKAWQKRHQLRDERYMQTWVIRILINECRNIQRKKSRLVPLFELPEREAPAGADRELHDALFALDEMLRLPIVLHYVEGFSVGEIAAILRLPEGTVKSRMLRGRRELQRQLNGEATEPCGISTT